jgi:hypothetical protein
MTDVCVHIGCERPQRARTLCEMHYGRLKRAGLGTLHRKQPRQAQGIQLDAQLGQNSNCVDCGAKPFGGGMRCLRCFQVRCDARAELRRSLPSVHECTVHRPSMYCYKACQCRCSGCRADKARDDKQRYAVRSA